MPPPISCNCPFYPVKATTKTTLGDGNTSSPATIANIKKKKKFKSDLVTFFKKKNRSVAWHLSVQHREIRSSSSLYSVHVICSCQHKQQACKELTYPRTFLQRAQVREKHKGVQPGETTAWTCPPRPAEHTEELKFCWTVIRCTDLKVDFGRQTR